MASWKVLQKLGEGVSAEVYGALTPEGRRVAVKRLLSVTEERLEVFEGQARLLVRLKHPAVASLLGYATRSDAIFGEDRGPCFWMEMVSGRPLLAAAKEADVETILGWFRDAVDALGYFHGQGLLHGDLSPQNLKVDDQGRLKILDFSVLPGDAAASDVATLPYMAPERIDGRPLPAADLFSLGTIFYEALAGRHPRAGCRTIHDLIAAEPAELSAVAPRMAEHALSARVIDRMIRADANSRFPDAASVVRALEGAVETSVPEPEEGFEFSPLTMIGAEEAFAAVSRALEAAAGGSVIVAVHGPSGAGTTRLRREIAFEAALKGFSCREFPDLHDRSAVDLGRFLSALREAPPSGVVTVFTWSEDRLSEEGRRFVSALLSEKGVVDAALANLKPDDARRLLENFLTRESTAESVNALFEATSGNPGRLLNLLRDMAAQGLLRARTLLPGWKDLLSKGTASEPEPKDPEDLSRFLRREVNRLNELGHYTQGLSVAERWFDLRAGDEPLPLKTVKYWFVTGWGLHNLGRFDEAEERLKRCVREAGTDPAEPEIATTAARARSLLGLAALRRGDAKAAESEFRAALALQPEAGFPTAETYRNLARALQASGDAAGAEAALDRAKSLYRDAGHQEGLFWCFLQEGNARLSQREAEAAACAYDAAETIAEETGSYLRKAVVWNNRALLERSQNKEAKAFGLLHKARDVLRYLGIPADIASNLKELVASEAALGRWTQAESFLKELRSLSPSVPEARAFSEEAEGQLEKFRDGRTDETQDSLKDLYESLPPELQVTFVDRGDFRKFHARSHSQEVPMAPTVSEVVPQEAFSAFKRVSEELLQEQEISKVLTRLMDAAMTLARAESGFLVLRAEGAGGPLPGYEVAVARNVTKEELQTDLYAFSVSAVRRALQDGQAVVTDNAVLDPLFRDARSVHLRQLKSIVALPVPDASGTPLGVFYLDHRFESGLFGGALLEALKAFAALAGLALQKGRMIEALNENNRDLTQRLQVQTRELSRSRLILKNEYSEIIGRSARMAEVLSLVDRITDAKVAVWVFGESGTGKESIARALHFNSARAKKPFVTENCGALPESLLESELFGHKKGAFTHATGDKKGLLAYADGGTVFLDEIADMSLNLQAKLLRFLQEGEIRPVGSNEVVRVDVRVVSASNRDLEELVAEGKFRQDLFYRLNGVTVKLPPLRERMEDLPLLAEHFLKKKDIRLSPEALRVFLNYSWPGNIRELQNTLETASLFAEEGLINPVSLQFKPALFRSRAAPAVSSSKPQPSAAVSQPPPPLDAVLVTTLRAIRDNAYHKGYAAKALGITRRALYARLQKFGLSTDVKDLKGKIEEWLPS